MMKDNPERIVTLHDIAGLVGLVLPLATTPANITSGFRVALLVPFKLKGTSPAIKSFNRFN